MQIDPVIAISEELRRVEGLLRRARAQGDDALCRKVLAEISVLSERLFRTTPTSTVGAAEILDRTSQLLADSFAYCAARMHAIAERFACGHRTLADFVWLRTTAKDLADGLYGEEGLIAAPLVASALAGASRPVLVFRAAKPPRAMHRKRSAS
ncbi:MAG TPA: hypothetical protein VL286_07985 [Rhizomicrobium sp.]|nr:hypothetical protein [Rhizomicrobium sp.]